jgi:hypothetical protein
MVPPPDEIGLMPTQLSRKAAQACYFALTRRWTLGGFDFSVGVRYAIIESSGTVGNVAVQERFDVLAIQPYDQVLHVIVVRPDSFYGHD